MAALPRMRTADGAYQELLKMDPDTQITKNMIQEIIRYNKIPVVAVGKKKLIDVDVLIEFFTGAAYEEYTSTGRVRRVGT